MNSYKHKGDSIYYLNSYSCPIHNDHIKKKAINHFISIL